MAAEKEHKPELLAPAGTLEAGVVALERGADAVYVGLTRFNARERAANCSLDEVAQLIGLARRRGRKVYVTVNTLVTDAELPEVGALLADLAPLAPHAVIAQDLGVIRLLRRCFPEIAVHASTQCGVHNSAGIRFLAHLGVQRVILERQITFPELTALLDHTVLPVEVFVHGALCCSRSGVCLFSSWLGGWSGNRGRCKQPCRRRYYAPDGNGFFFSTRDLCLLESVPDLCRAGIAALKIEGRLRGPDYVAHAVTAYRMVLDSDEHERTETLSAARRVLASSLGRKWFRGFRTAADFENMIEHRKMGGAGLLCGTVRARSAPGFLVRLSRPLAVGDRVRVQPASGEQGPALTVTRLTVSGRDRSSARAGQDCLIHCRVPVPARGFLYKIGTELPISRTQPQSLTRPLGAVALGVRIAANRIEVRIRQLPPGTVWQQSLALAAASRHAIAPATVRAEFAKTGTPLWMVSRVEVAAESGLFLPLSELKALRKALWDWARPRLDDSQVQAVAEQSRERVRAECDNTSTAPVTDLVVTTVRVRGRAPNPLPKTLTARDPADIGATVITDEVVLPDFCPEPELDSLRATLEDLVARGVRSFRVTSLYGFELLPHRDDLRVTASFPIPVCNRLALCELLECDVRRATAWPELDAAALKDLCRCDQSRLELFVFGRLPLLATRALLPATGDIRDGRGIAFRVIRENGQTLVLPDVPLRLSQHADVSTYMDLTWARLEEQDRGRAFPPTV